MNQTRVEIYRDDGAGVWKTVSEERVLGANGARLTIPAETETDLGSVPRVLWPLIAPFEIGATAVVVHDYLYRHQGHPPTKTAPAGVRWTRYDADRELLYHAVGAGASVWRAVAAYYAVRIFGAFFWSRHASTDAGDGGR